MHVIFFPLPLVPTVSSVAAPVFFRTLEVEGRIEDLPSLRLPRAERLL